MALLDIMVLVGIVLMAAGIYQYDRRLCVIFVGASLITISIRSGGK